MRVPAQALLEAHPVVERLRRRRRHDRGHDRAHEELDAQRVQEADEVRVVVAPLRAAAAAARVGAAERGVVVGVEAVDLVEVVVGAVQREPERRDAPVAVVVLPHRARGDPGPDVLGGGARRRARRSAPEPASSEPSSASLRGLVCLLGVLGFRVALCGARERRGLLGAAACFSDRGLRALRPTSSTRQVRRWTRQQQPLGEPWRRRRYGSTAATTTSAARSTRAAWSGASSTSASSGCPRRTPPSRRTRSSRDSTSSRRPRRVRTWLSVALW